MAERLEQGAIPDFSVAFGALKGVFPELADEQVRAQVFFLERLKPSPLKKNSFVLVKPGVEIEKSRLEKTPAVVFFAEKSGLETVDSWFAQNTSLLKPEAGVWVVEDKQQMSEDEKQIRLNIMESWGLVIRKVTQVMGKYCWYGRIAKERHAKGADITEEGYYQAVLDQTVGEYKRQGWSVDFSEFEEEARHCRHIPNFLGRIELGFGLKLKSDCGCRWHVTGKGNWERLETCSRECEGEPIKYRPKKPSFLVGDDIPSSLVGKEYRCYACQAELLFDRRIVEEKEGFTLVLSSLKCPHCGFKGLREIKTKSKVVRYERKN